ncbi:MAG: carboxypeptidase regulatory-like domain-containing protein [Bryobacteraceae bacterium]
MRYGWLLVAGGFLLAGQVPDPAPAAAVKAEDKCTIEGSVVNAVTGEAVKKVNITLRQMGNMNNTAHSAISDAAGHFKIEDADPGRYSMIAARTGFVIQQYGAKGPSRPGTNLTLTAGQSMKDIVFKLTPQGVVTGRVVDEDGDPVAQVIMQCLRYTYNRGKKQLMPFGNANTNDLGEYRIFGLAPGRYYLSAQYQVNNFQGGYPAASDPKKKNEEAYAPAYYPNSATVEGAAPLEVAPGAQLRGIDVALAKTRAVRVRGQLINPSGNKRQAMISLMPRNSGFMGMMGRNNARVTDDKGSFELHNVVPGSYVLVAQMFNSDKPSMAKLPIEVGTSNIDGIQLTISPTQDLTGHVVVENNADTGGAVFNVYLLSKNPGPFGGGGAGQIDNNGTFTLKNLMPDAYSVNVNGMRDNLYVKSIRFGDADVTESGVDFTQGVTAGEFTIVVSAAGGQIDGTVQNDKSEPAAGAMVVLIPAPEKRENDRLYKTASTDQTGKFSIKGIVPGEYKLFAWEQVDFGAYQDPDFLKPYESKGESVSIKENAHESKQIKAIATDAHE